MFAPRPAVAWRGVQLLDGTEKVSGDSSMAAAGEAETESGELAALPGSLEWGEDPVEEGEDPVAAAVRAVVHGYLSLAQGGEPPADFTDATPFMEAGLDSLDLLKVGDLRSRVLGFKAVS